MQRLLSWTEFCTWLSGRRVVQEEEEGNLVRLKKVAPSRASTVTPETPFGRNGGVVCDAFTGPCACGAWH